jgi:malate synthase
VPVFNLMEDAATAEISRSQIWQWIRNPKGVLDDGRKVTKALVRELLAEEVARIATLAGSAEAGPAAYQRAARLFEEIATRDEYVEFLTLPAYDLLTEDASKERVVETEEAQEASV